MVHLTLKISLSNDLWLLLIVIGIFCTSTCGKTAKMHPNDIALELAKMERIGDIAQSDIKSGIISIFDEQMKADFRKHGFGHRIDEITSTWSVYQDNEYVIIVGSIARSDDDIYIFCDVYENQGGGKFNLVYNQIGNNTPEGSYPTGVVPFTHLQEQSLILIQKNIQNRHCFYTDLSYAYDYEYSRTYYPTRQVTSATIKVQSKHDKRHIQTILIEGSSLLNTDTLDCYSAISYTTNRNLDQEWVGNDRNFGNLIVADLNFDSREDLAVISGIGSKAPLYSYFIQTDLGMFVEDEYLNKEMSHFPEEIDSERQELRRLWWQLVGKTLYQRILRYDNDQMVWIKKDTCLKGCDKQ